MADLIGGGTSLGVELLQRMRIHLKERECFIDNLLVRIHRCFWWTGLAPWEFEFPVPGSLISTLLSHLIERDNRLRAHKVTSPHTQPACGWICG